MNVQDVTSRHCQRAKGLRVPGEKRGPRAGRGVRDLTRASDLPSPAPAGHLLRELGQSERELIQESHSDPTVPQVLALLNSFLEQKLLTIAGRGRARKIRLSLGMSFACATVGPTFRVGHERAVPWLLTIALFCMVPFRMHLIRVRLARVVTR